MITDRIELSPLPLFINIIYIFALFDFRDPFLKSPDYFLGLKSCFMFVVFQFKIKVSIILKMIQRNYQLTKQNWLVCETVILFNWFWFQNLPAFNFQSKQMAKYFLRNYWNIELQPCMKYLSNPENREHLKFFRNVDHCIKFRTHDQTSEPLTNERFCLRFNYLKPYYYWLVSHNTITFHKYFWCSQFCEFHCKPTLSGHPQGTGKWPLHGGWPVNRISS